MGALSQWHRSKSLVIIVERSQYWQASDFPSRTRAQWWHILLQTARRTVSCMEPGKEHRWHTVNTVNRWYKTLIAESPVFVILLRGLLVKGLGLWTIGPKIREAPHIRAEALGPQTWAATVSLQQQQRRQQQRRQSLTFISTITTTTVSTRWTTSSRTRRQWGRRPRPSPRPLAWPSSRTFMRPASPSTTSWSSTTWRQTAPPCSPARTLTCLTSTLTVHIHTLTRTVTRQPPWVCTFPYNPHSVRSASPVVLPLPRVGVQRTYTFLIEPTTPTTTVSAVVYISYTYSMWLFEILLPVCIHCNQHMWHVIYTLLFTVINACNMLFEWSSILHNTQRKTETKVENIRRGGGNNHWGHPSFCCLCSYKMYIVTSFPHLRDDNIHIHRIQSATRREFTARLNNNKTSCAAYFSTLKKAKCTVQTQPQSEIT